MRHNEVPKNRWAEAGVYPVQQSDNLTVYSHIRGSAHASKIINGEVAFEVACAEHRAAQRLAETLKIQRRTTLAEAAYPEARALLAGSRRQPGSVDGWSSALKGRRFLEGR